MLASDIIDDAAATVFSISSTEMTVLASDIIDDAAATVFSISSS